MKYRFASRMDGMEASAIREILKSAGEPGVISFAAGNPAPESFPVEEMEHIAEFLFRERPRQALQYGISEGYPKLREQTASRLKRRWNIGKPFDQVMILSGGQQGMELSAKVLADPGDTVLCEDPSFIGAINAFKSYGLRLRSVAMDRDGICPDALEAAVKNDRRVRFLYTIPTFQNPSGRTASQERREAVLALARKYDFLILEDDPYGELRYSGEPVAPLKSMDEEGRVIYVGSYSKVLAPGIRTGFLCAHRNLMERLVIAKQVSDVHTNQFFMMLVSEYLDRYDLDRHILKVRELYRSKRDRMAEAMARHFPREVKYQIPDGGLFLWCRLPEGADCAEACWKKDGRTVSVVPGKAFDVEPRTLTPAFRMNFSLPGPEEIDEGVAILGAGLKEYLEALK